MVQTAANGQIAGWLKAAPGGPVVIELWRAEIAQVGAIA